MNLSVSRSAASQGRRTRRAEKTRVCDNCIRQKVKCTLEFPSCSRCSERGTVCVYSLERRKPGPRRGTKKRVSNPQNTSPTVPRPGSGQEYCPDSVDAYQVLTFDLATPTTTSIPHTQTCTVAESPQSTQSRSSNARLLPMLPEEQDFLLKKYMETLHHALPMFTHSIAVANSSCNQQILYTICILMAKLENFSFSSVNDVELEAHVQLLLGSSAIDEDCLGHLPLNEMRKVCLTSFYEFHQFPGHQAWEKIGKLVRTAYWMGLDRLDDTDRLTLDLEAAGPDGVSQTFRDEDIAEWRLLWWSVYRLDSYANFAAGTPYMAHEDIAATQLLRSSNYANNSAGPSKDQEEGLYLNSDLGKLRRLIPVVAGAQDSTRLFNLHLVTIATLRKVKKGLEQRFTYQRQKTNAHIQYSTCIERELNALRLTLPANYLNPMRNALARETQLEHHSRLVNILHLHMARLIIAIYNCGTLEDGEEWLLKWQQILDSAQEIAMVTEQWNTAYTLSVDPAISFIIFTALVFVHLHKKSSLPKEMLPDYLEHAETVLFLHLEHFANIWTLPRLLILSFKSIRESLDGALKYQHIQLIVSHFAAPVHPRWLRFLSSMQTKLVHCA